MSVVASTVGHLHCELVVLFSPILCNTILLNTMYIGDFYGDFPLRPVCCRNPLVSRSRKVMNFLFWGGSMVFRQCFRLGDGKKLYRSRFSRLLLDRWRKGAFLHSLSVRTCRDTCSTPYLKRGTGTWRCCQGSENWTLFLVNVKQRCLLWTDKGVQKRRLNRRLIYECRWDESLKVKSDGCTRHTLCYVKRRQRVCLFPGEYNRLVYLQQNKKRRRTKG